MQEMKMMKRKLESYFHEHLTDEINTILMVFMRNLYYNQSYCWYAFIRQDFLMYYRYTQKWVDLFTAVTGNG